MSKNKLVVHQEESPGSTGVAAIKKCGGSCIVQDPAEIMVTTLSIVTEPGA